MKVYIALTPLVLQSAAGDDFRVEKGQAVELTDEQYQDVAAHVMPSEVADEDVAQAEQSHEQTPEQTPAKTRRNAKQKEQ